jgi:hypothetical protein
MEVESQVVYANEFIRRSATNVEGFRPFGGKVYWRLVHGCEKVVFKGWVGFAEFFNTNFLCW